jgi:putative ABC transport system ATP-binding protein
MEQVMSTETAKEMTEIISMKNICKSYIMGDDKLDVLKSVECSGKKGEFVAILGPSGSGKSTLMNIIGCMDKFDIGEYYLNGIPIHQIKEKALVKIRNKEIGFIFQNYHLISTYTVIQNIIMPLLMRGMDRKQAEQECMDVVRMLGLDDRIHHKPSELSGGQRQRVAIARALCSKPSILLADEPTGALDQKSGTEVLKLFTKLHEMGNTIVMITHDLNVAEWAQRTVRIVDGEVFEN